MGMASVLWIALFALVLGAVISSLHLSLAHLSRSVLESLTAKRARPETSRHVAKILDDVEGHARAMALPRLVCNLTVTVCLVWWILLLGAGEAHLPATGGERVLGDDPAMSLAEAVIAMAVAAVVLWFDSVIIPMSIANHAGERLVYTLAWLVRAVYVVESPVQPVVRFFDRTAARLSGSQGAADSKEEMQAEILSVVEEGEREGAIDESAKQMIGAVVEFRSRTVEQIMTPRTELAALEATDDLKTVLEFVGRDGHSRVPVYERDLDHIIGVLYAKDLLKAVGARATGGTTAAFRIRDVLRPAVFVPETKTVRELLAELLGMRVHIAIVADEFGGTSGLVTIEDIIEEVFGEITDEYETSKDDAPRVEMDARLRSVVIDARASIRAANDVLREVGREIPESEHYDTVAGYAMTSLGRIPDEGDSFREGDMLVTVTEAAPTRVVRVRIDIPETGVADDAETVEPGAKGTEPAEDRAAGEAAGLSVVAADQARRIRAAG